MQQQEKVALVTGANGFVGSFITKRLREEGIRVRALARRPEAEAEVRALGAEPVPGSMTEATALREALTGTHYVVHCAATGSDDMAEAMAINATGTATLLEAAKASGCERFVHVSTLGVYDLEGREVIDENTPRVTTTGWAYAASKAEAERHVFEAMRQGLPAVILRPPAILGVHPTSTWGQKIPSAIAAGRFAVAGNGEYHFFYVHVRNLAEAVVLSLRSEAAVGQAFDIVDGHTTWRRYAEHFRSGPLATMPETQAPAFMRTRARFPGEKARKVLGYTPRYSFEEVMRETQQALSATR
jgi:nucleoside-diphosphate-sugar epimerase